MRAPLAALGIACFMATTAGAQLPKAEHAAKRQAVLDAMTRDGIIIIEGTGSPPREDQSYMQAQNFQVLTGLLQPNSALVMWKKNGVTGQRVIVPPRPVYSWEGDLIGPVEATAITGIPASPSTGLRALLDSLEAPTSKVYFLAQDAGWPGLSNQVIGALGDSGLIRPRGFGGRGAGAATTPPPENDMLAISQAMSRARAKKTDTEIALLQKAGEISNLGHIAGMRAAYPGVTEYEIRGAIEGVFIANGGDRVGYPTIVGTGANGTFLHYSADTARSKAGDVVVVDAATTYKGYSADITRTFPVNGKFSPEQKILYNAVLAAENAAGAAVKPGTNMQEISRIADVELWKGLMQAGLIDSIGATYVPVATGGGRGGAGGGTFRPSQLSLFYFHSLGHGIGLNVHDPIYLEEGRFAVNSVFTIEPGLYIRPNSLDMVADVPENQAFRDRLKRMLPKYSGIGTRVEDDYVVTATGGRCLTCVGSPRTIQEVEAITGKGAKKR